VFAALNQLQIAPTIVNGLFYAALAIVAGSAIIAIGLGGVEPMRQRWQRVLDRYDEEKPRWQEELRAARERSTVVLPPGDGENMSRPGARGTRQ